MAGGPGLLRVTDMAVAAEHALFGLLAEVKIGGRASFNEKRRLVWSGC